MINENVDNVNLLIVDYMFWDVAYPISKKEATLEQVEDEIPIEKDIKLFVHNNQMGQQLGCEIKSEVKIADGAVVDAIWQTRIGNMQRDIYAFEVQTYSSIDSLILDLQKATNNFTVQAIVAVSDEKKIERINKESKSIQAFESKLKTQDYKEVLEIHNCLERINEIINNLGLVSDSFM